MSKCIVKILRDETPGGLAEKINKIGRAHV